MRFVLGGGSQIYVGSHDQSPVLKIVELFGCSASSIPNYPIKVFWHKHDFDGKDGVLRMSGVKRHIRSAIREKQSEI